MTKVLVTLALAVIFLIAASALVPTKARSVDDQQAIALTIESGTFLEAESFASVTIETTESRQEPTALQMGVIYENKIAYSRTEYPIRS